MRSAHPRRHLGFLSAVAMTSAGIQAAHAELTIPTAAALGLITQLPLEPGVFAGPYAPPKPPAEVASMATVSAFLDRISSPSMPHLASATTFMVQPSLPLNLSSSGLFFSITGMGATVMTAFTAGSYATLNAVGAASATFASASAGGFEIGMSNPTNEDGYSVYVLSALNTGGNGTGSGFIGFDMNVTTPGTGATGALRIQNVDDLNGSGTSGADVLGKASGTFGSIDGTFMGIGRSADADNVSPLFLSFTLNAAGHFGSWDGLDESNDTDLHSLAIVGVFLGAANATYDDNVFVPFANIVVPTGAHFDASGMVAGDIGAPQSFDISNGTPTPPPPPPVNVVASALIQTSTVPEPASAIGFVLAAAGVLRRRSNRDSVDRA